MKQLTDNLLVGQRRTLDAHSALLAIHWQYDVVAPGGALSETFASAVRDRDVIPKMARLISHFRSAGAHIVHVIVRHESKHVGHVANNALFNLVAKSDRFLNGTPGVEVIRELGLEDRDIVLYHSRISCFHGSELLTYLIGHGIRALYLTGVATNVAVDHTARDAVQSGFDTYLVEDCCASADMAYHDAALMTLRLLCTGIVTSDELINANHHVEK